MAPRRHYSRSRSTSYNIPAPIPPPPPNQDPMPPSSRYLQNLRVIQRHDPSITSLFDQFPHVCVYHHKGDEWQKKGCEGAMFLFERDQEPKYGFYILNRNNTGDYIQRMTPDDDVEFASAYLIYRAYGKVTSDTIGLWTMVTQDREAMSQVMMRLHSYIKRNIRYPDEYRRRPDTWSTTPAPVHVQALPLPSTASSANDSSSNPISTLSELLKKLEDPAEPASASSPPVRTVSDTVPPPATGIPLLDSIFASASEAASSSGTPTRPSETFSPGGDALHALFANGIRAPVKAPSSGSVSCDPTPTQHLTQLPDSSLPMKVTAKINGIHPNSTLGRTVFPAPTAGNGRTPASNDLMQPNGWKVGANQSNGNRHPVSREDDESWEEDTSASVSAGITEGSVDPLSHLRKAKTRKTKKREREREKRRTLKYEAGRSPGSDDVRGSREERVEWPLVDDRSLSVDGVDDEEGSVGLGDGLLNALAAVSEPEMLNGLSSHAQEHSAGPKRKKERGKERRKRRLHQREDTMGGAQMSDVLAKSIIQRDEARDALLDTFGRRRRIGDSVLEQGALAGELVQLIQNDPAFMRELHRLYLRRVQV